MTQNSTKPSTVVPLKVGFFGEQGTGKTTTAALLAAAISKQHHNGAPVWVTDPELGWQFPKRRIFGTEKIELVQRTVPTFKAMVQDLREAERAGACVYVVELAKIWRELLDTVQKRCGDRWGTELGKLWTNEWVNLFLNSPLHCMALARVSDITEDVQKENGEITRVKVAEGMKAGGQRNNFGYEPHLVLRMLLERNPRRKKNGVIVEGEGRMVHRADVLKDRTWELNGKVLRFPDRASYKPGDFSQVWNAIKPHFLETQAIGETPQLETAENSDDLVGDDGRSAWNHERAEREVLFDEFQELGELMFGGQTREAKRTRVLVAEAITGEISKERIKQMPTSQLEHAVKVLQAMRKRIESGQVPNAEADLVHLVELSTKDVVEPEKQHPTLMEFLLSFHPPKKRPVETVAMAGD